MVGIDLKELVEFAHRVAVRYTKRYDPEYLSIAHCALLRALKTYDESRGVPLRGWISFVIKRGIQYHWRRNRRQELRGNLFWDTVADRTEPDEAAWEALEKLSAFDREVAVAYFIEGATIPEIAARYPECSAKRLGKYMGRLRAKIWALREELKA